MELTVIVLQIQVKDEWVFPNRSDRFVKPSTAHMHCNFGKFVEGLPYKCFWKAQPGRKVSTYDRQL